MKQHYTEEQKRALYEKAQGFRASGLSIKNACAQANIAIATYHSWKAKFEDEPKVVVHNVDEEDYKPKLYNKKPKSTGKAIVIVTDIGSLASVLKELA